MSSAHFIAERALSVIELVLGSILAVASAGAFKYAYFPTKTANLSDPENWEAPAWAALAFVVFAPVCLSLAIAGLTMLKQTKHHWWYQLIPLFAVGGATYFLLGPHG